MRRRTKRRFWGVVFSVGLALVIVGTAATSVGLACSYGEVHWGGVDECAYGGNLHWVLTAEGAGYFVSGTLYVTFEAGGGGQYNGSVSGDQQSISFSSSGTSKVISAYARYGYEEARDNPVLSVTGSTCNTEPTTTSTTATTVPSGGSLVITKKIEGDQPPDSTWSYGDFTITVKGPGQSGTVVYSGPFGPDGTVTLTNLAAGNYYVYEDDPGYPWDVSGEGGVEVKKDKQASKTIHNYGETTTTTVPRGKIVITKKIEGDQPPDTTWDYDDFTITVTGPGQGGPVVYSGPFGSDGKVTLTSLAYGEYYVSENVPGYPWHVYGEGSVKLDKHHQQGSMTITNYGETTTTTRPRVGSLVITKKIEGDQPPDSIWSYGDFTITVNGPGQSGPEVYNGPFGLDGTVTLTSLPVGQYYVNEVDPGYPWDVSGEGGVEVKKDKQASKTITNDGETTTTTIAPRGSLVITKKIEGDEPPAWDYGEFNVIVKGPATWSSPGPVVYDGPFDQNGRIILTGLAPGWYTVSESPPGYPWTASGGGNALVWYWWVAEQTITNTGHTTTTAQQYGALEIYKAFDAPGMTTNPGDFSIVVTGPDGPSVVWQGSFPANGDPVTLTSLVPGTYSVYEDTPGDPLTWWKVEGEDGSVSVVENQTPTVTITNYGSTTSTTGPWGCLEITKQVTGDPPAGWTYGQFVITVSGPAGDDSTTTSLAFDESGKILLCGLAPGTYAITETDPGIAWEVLYPEGQTVVVSTSTTVDRTVINDPTTTSTTTAGSTTSASITTTSVGGSTTSVGGSTTSVGGGTTTKKATSTTVKGWISTPEGIQTGGGGMADSGKWVWVVMALAGVVLTGAGASHLRPRRSAK